MKPAKETFLLALELESSLRAPLNRSTFKTRERCFTCEGYGHHANECSSIKCSNCGEFRHNGYQCPSKSQHTNNVQIDDIDNSKIVEDVQIPSEVTSDDD